MSLTTAVAYLQVPITNVAAVIGWNTTRIDDDAENHEANASDDLEGAQELAGGTVLLVTLLGARHDALGIACGVIVENVATKRGARTMTLDAKTHKLYLPTAEFGPPPAPTADRPHPRPAIIPNSFVVLVYGK